MNDDGMKDEKSGFAFGMSSRWGNRNIKINKKEFLCLSHNCCVVLHDPRRRRSVSNEEWKIRKNDSEMSNQMHQDVHHSRWTWSMQRRIFPKVFREWISCCSYMLGSFHNIYERKKINQLNRKKLNVSISKGLKIYNIRSRFFSSIVI
jgi:hypothetical protein